MQLNDASIKRQNEILGRRAVIVAGATAFALAAVKFAAGLIGGSVAVLSSAIDSMLDLLVSALNFFAIRKSQAAPDAKFNFGYAKLEALAAMFEGVLIVGAGAFIFYESVRKLQTEQAPVDTAFSLYAMALSVAVTGLLVAYLSRVARRTRNLIVRADALHYKSDLFSNLAVIASLILVEFTGFAAIDAVFGIVISG
mgnify:FL=1